MASNVDKLIAELRAFENPSDAIFCQRFFKTGPGEYGEGDMFLGIRVPNTRAITKKYYKDLSVADFETLLTSKWHEVRLAGLVAMQLQFVRASESAKTEIYNLYLKNIGKGINNWDLVDVTCAHIVGPYLINKNRDELYELAKGGLWQKRVAIISTFAFLRNGDPGDTYKLAEILIYEQHDLLHKAVGWSLREMGKMDITLLEKFLDQYAATMPRTTLRYAIEKLPTQQKNHYMKLKI